MRYRQIPKRLSCGQRQLNKSWGSGITELYHREEEPGTQREKLSEPGLRLLSVRGTLPGRVRIARLTVACYPPRSANAHQSLKIEWVVEGKLAFHCRPGYSGGACLQVPQLVVTQWINEVKSAGVKSIICLLDEEHLALYRELPDGLLDYYRVAGLFVAPAPIKDYGKLTSGQRKTVWEAYQCLKKPVLVHCSAGQGRTGQVIDHILDKLEQ